MLEDGYITARDEKLFQITDDVEEVCRIMDGTTTHDSATGSLANTEPHKCDMTDGRVE